VALPSLSDKQWKDLIKYRFSCVVVNPVRVWSIEEKEYRFQRGSNHPKGLHMSNLGALVRNIFYDKKTNTIYSLEGNLNRKLAIIEDPDFLEILKYEWQCERLWSFFMPHSLEYMARCYKYLIQNVIEPDLDVMEIKEMLRNFFALTFEKLTVGREIGRVNSLEEKKQLEERRRKEYITFGENLVKLSEDFANHKPYRAFIVKDLTDYSIEKEYEDPDKRLAAIKKILSI